MSLRIEKPGLLDSFQDQGRVGYRHLGVHTSGAMDALALAVGNFLVGNDPGEAVLEMHIPAPTLFFEADALIALCGADVSPRLDGCPVPGWTAIRTRRGTTLTFGRPAFGTRCYLALAGGFDLTPWLGSRSTSLVAGAGGWRGRPLQAGDVVPFRRPTVLPENINAPGIERVPWQVNARPLYGDMGVIRFCPGPEYGRLDPASKQALENALWQLSPESDRMACAVQGPDLHLQDPIELVSAAVVPGVLQLLPNGRLLILMADCQTTGGYPRIGSVASADLPKLAQMPAGHRFRFQAVDIPTAYSLRQQQAQTLRRIEWSCRLRPAFPG